MIFQPGWLRKHFAAPHALAGVYAYSLAIVCANLDKSVDEVGVLVARQATMTFLFTGILVPRVQRYAIKNDWLSVIVRGILAPALIVAIASVSAHWYWTDEVRNIFAPFSLSVLLNSFLIAARRAGHETFGTQLRWFIGLLKRH